MHAVIHYEEPIGTHVLSPTDTLHVFETAREALDFMSSDQGYRTWAPVGWEQMLESGEWFTGDELYGGISRSYKESDPPEGVTTTPQDNTDFITEWFQVAAGALALYAFLFFGAAL